MPFAVVVKNQSAVARCVDDQVEVTIAVKVDKSCACRPLPHTGHPCLVRDIFETQIAQVAVKPILTIRPAEVEVTQSIAIHISGCDTRPVEENMVGKMRLLGNHVGKGNSRLGSSEQLESGLAGLRYR